MSPSRTHRLHQLIELLNRIHCRRRLLGKPTAHLMPRCRALSAAYLQSRHADLSAEN